MNDPEPSHGVIGLRTAFILYALLAVAAFFSLKGTALVIALVVVAALAAKSYVHHVRSRME
jgi:archaellin